MPKLKTNLELNKNRFLAMVKVRLPAKRHINPRGKEIGGWVAETAKVDKTATVLFDAMVGGNAQVKHKAIIADRAKVYDKSFSG